MHLQEAYFFLILNDQKKHSAVDVRDEGQIDAIDTPSSFYPSPQYQTAEIPELTDSRCVHFLQTKQPNTVLLQQWVLGSEPLQIGEDGFPWVPLTPLPGVGAPTGRKAQRLVKDLNYYRLQHSILSMTSTKFSFS